MSSAPAKDQDLEATAELPVLDIATYESRQPQSSTPATAPVSVASSPARDGASNKQLSRLEDDLRSLSNTLRDVEERLSLKGQRLAEIERELESERAARAAADVRAENLNRELASAQTALSIAQLRISELTGHIETKETVTRAQSARLIELESHVSTAARALEQAQTTHREMEARVAGYVETLQTYESRRGIFEVLLRGLDEEVDERGARIAYLEREHAKNIERANELDVELTGRIKRIAALEAEVNKLGIALSNANKEAEIKERVHDELRKQVSQLTAQVATHVERVRSLEAEFNTRTQEHSAASRAELEARLAATQAELGGQLTAAQNALKEQLTQAHADREQQLATVRAERDQQLSALRAEHAEKLSAVRAEIEGKHAAAQGELASRAVALQSELESRTAALQAELESRTAALRALESQARELQDRATRAEGRLLENDSQIGDQQETIARLHEELRAMREKLDVSEGDVRAAEELLNRIESDLRAKSAKLDETLKIQEEWRSTVEAARQALDERDTAIRRLENEAANSAALLDDIQHSIKRLDSPIANGAANGNELAPEGATRLLIRTEGDSEVVHVLGRKTTVGRTPDNDLQIDTKFISRHHAVILAAPAHTIIEDLNSTNGVMVNGRRIRRQPLKDGDMVAIGKTHFRFAVRQASAR
jgi:chromosome segregation ATPase